MVAFVLVIMTKKTKDILWFTICLNTLAFTICLNTLANFGYKLTFDDVVVEDETIQT
jgi:hypothetical protein